MASFSSNLNAQGFLGLHLEFDLEPNIRPRTAAITVKRQPLGNGSFSYDFETFGFALNENSSNLSLDQLRDLVSLFLLERLIVPVAPIA